MLWVLLFVHCKRQWAFRMSLHQIYTHRIVPVSRLSRSIICRSQMSSPCLCVFPSFERVFVAARPPFFINYRTSICCEFGVPPAIENMPIMMPKGNRASNGIGMLASIDTRCQMLFGSDREIYLLVMLYKLFGAPSHSSAQVKSQGNNPYQASFEFAMLLR